MKKLESLIIQFYLIDIIEIKEYYNLIFELCYISLKDYIKIKIYFLRIVLILI